MNFVELSKSSGKGSFEVNARVPENDTNDEREQILTVTKVAKGEKKYVTVRQAAGHVVVIPEFDYLVLRYGWSQTSGTDFDTATGFVNTGIQGVDGKLVGWSRRYEYTSEKIGDYLIHGGDNMSSGREAALINMKTLLEGNMETLPEFIQLNVYGNWYGAKGDGRVSISFTAYKGGIMRKEGFNFINDGGEEVYSGTENTTVNAQGESNFQNIPNLYTKMGTMEYDKNERSCMFYVNR